MFDPPPVSLPQPASQLSNLMHLLILPLNRILKQVLSYSSEPKLLIVFLFLRHALTTTLGNRLKPSEDLFRFLRVWSRLDDKRRAILNKKVEEGDKVNSTPDI